MCILTLFRNNQGFILTHSRDENLERKPLRVLQSKNIKGQNISFPMDVQSGGSWIMTSPKWTTAILNGGFEKHIRNPPYKHSRGQFPFLIATFNDAEEYTSSLNLEGIEPFTQIIVDNETNEAFHFVWNGEQKVFRQIEEDFFHVCSATLYPKEKKEFVKNQFLSLKSYTSDSLSQKHKDLFWEYNPQLPLIRTTSLVQIIQKEDEKTMNYKTFNI